MDVNHSASAYSNPSPLAAQPASAHRPASLDTENSRAAVKLAAGSKRDTAAAENGRPAQVRNADEIGRRRPVVDSSASDDARTDNRRGTRLDLVV